MPLKIWLLSKIVGCGYTMAHAYVTSRLGRYTWTGETIDDIVREQIDVQNQAVLLVDEQAEEVGS